MHNAPVRFRAVFFTSNVLGRGVILTLRLAPVTQVLAAAALVMTMVWFLHFDTGLDWSNADCAGKPCVFNYHPILMVAGFGLLGFNGMVIDGIS